MAPHDLPGLLTPFDAGDFLRTCWGQNFLHVPGVPGKFRELLPWPVLNRILEEHRLDPPRMRLTREGRPVPPASYLNYQTNRRRPNVPIPRLRAAGFERALRDGATLVLDAVDELHRPVTDVAESLERTFRVKIQVNAYAGWRTSHGFDLHWDDHDVFVLQVAGRKQWKIYGMTRKYPLAVDSEPTDDKPSTPLWEGMLEDGDLLYIPRGWWHVATPLDEPTLHLTVGVNNPTGAELLAWYANRLRSSEDVRRDLPLFAEPKDQAARMERLRDLMMAEWKPELMQQYLAERDAASRPRARLNLPWSGMPDVLLAEGEPFRVQWSIPRVPRVEHTGSEVHVTALGQRWRFAASAAPMLEKLVTGQPCAASDLVTGELADSTVRLFLRELIAAGLIVVL